MIMLLGGLYLGWLAYVLLKSAFKKGAAPQAEVQAAGSGFRSFVVGLLTNLSNAKALIYFSSVFSLFVTGNMGSTEAAVIYAVVVLESLLWFSFVALILGMPKPKAFYRRSGKWIDGICGAIFGAFGAALVWTALKEATH